MDVKLFIANYFNLIFSIGIFYAIGFIIFSIFKIRFTQKYAQLFYQLIVGVLIFVMFVAIVKTSGKTIMVFLIFPLGLFLKTIKSNSNHQLPKTISFYLTPILSLFLVLFAILLIHTNKYYTTSEIYFALPHIDYIHYAKLSYFLWETGIENFNIDYVYKQNGVAPYHYFELWLNIGLSKLLGTNELTQLIFGTYLLGISIVWLGIVAIAERFIKINALTLFACFAILFISGLYFNFYNNIAFLQPATTFALFLFSNTKVFPIYLFLIFSILGFLSKNNLQIIAGALFLSICYNTTLPTIFSTLFICSAIQYVLTRKKEYAYYLASITILGVLILTFYLVFGTKDVSQSSVLSTDIDIKSYARTVINICIGANIHLFIVFLPFLLIFIGQYKKVYTNNKELIIYSIILYILALISWALLHKMDNSVQLFSNLILPLIILLIITFGCSIINDTSNTKKWLTLFFILILCSYNFIQTIKKQTLKNDTEYLENTLSEAKNTNGNGAFIYDKSKYNSYFSKISNYSVPGLHLSYISSKFQPISLSVFDIPLDKTQVLYNAEKELVKTSIFYKYVENQKQKKRFVSIEQSQIDFIKEYNIEYLITSEKAILNEKLQSLVKKEFVDSKSKERFYILR